jgi:hypothetical protein
VPHPVGQAGRGFAVVPEMVLEHRWQSWSGVRRRRPQDVGPERMTASP